MPKTPDHVDLPGAAEEAAAIKLLCGERARLLGLTDTAPATHEAVFDALPEHTWVHFACHGSSDLNKPSDSHLLLADRPLTVTDLTHLRLTNADLAFLSACTTFRSGTRLLDEPIHLAAACQLAGFSHVVASLWPISDRDTAWLSRRFYTTVTAEAKVDAFANALHHAVRMLRDARRDRPHRWAPYIHTGP
jgi:CHAT domain-containing protein